jgi:RNA polymerase sigma-70 factor (ECF subfamily)
VRVFHQEFEHVYRTLQRLGASAADAEDLTQEVFLVMLRRRRDWDPDKPLRPWLSSIAFRVAMAHRRRRAREVPGGLLDTEDSAPQLDEKLASAAARRFVLQALAALAPGQRAVLVLHEIDGLTVKRVAEALGLPLFTAYSRLRAARVAFAKEVRRRNLLDRARSVEHGAFLPVTLLTERGVPDGLPRTGLLQARGVPDGLPGTGLLQARRVPDRLPRSGLLQAPAAAMGVLALGLLGFVGATQVHAQRPSGHAALPAAAIQTAPGRMAAHLPARAMPRTVPALTAPGTPDLARSLKRGLVGYWRFDEPRGAAAAPDLSGQGSDCHLRRSDSADWVEGALGGAVRLRGGGWLECPATLASQRIGSELTISAWVQRPQRQRNLRTIVSRQRGTGSGDDFYLGLIDDERLIFASDVWHRVTAPVPRPLDRWFHVAAVRSPTGVLRLYLDGSEVARARAPRRMIPGTLVGSPYANPILVGAANNRADPSHVDQKLRGAIDELLIHDRALSAEEIAALASGLQPPL